MKKELLLLLFVTSLLSACTMQTTAPEENTNQNVVVVQQPEPEDNTPSPIIPTREERMKQDAVEAGYVGTPLAGDKTFYMPFNMVDYNFALSIDKLIFLNFYSTECTYCQNDNDAAIAAFDSMDYEDVVGFRVLFDDPASTLDDKDITLKYGVENLNTKIIVKGGKRVFKATDTWNKQTFIDEINRNRG